MTKDRSECSSKRLTAVDLFSGCGGLSCGLKLAGFEVLAAVEIDKKAQATYKLNHPSVRLYEDDIRKIDPTQVLRDAKLEIGKLDLLAGCPPCQGFSRLRTKNKTNFVKDERNNLVADFLRFGMRDELTRLGYKTVVHVLDAADYQVAQRRKRLIMLASRVHMPAIAPKFGSLMTVRKALEGVGAPSTTKDALHAMPENRSQAVRDLIALIPKDGGSRTDLAERYQLECHKRSDGFNDVYGRMAWDKVSPTITSGCNNPSKGRFLHPSYNRTITLREAALLQGFPKDYKFVTSHGKGSIALMIGNALPPPFIAAHANALRHGLELARGQKG
jgi:DNA (cytosine-5)-methyltransferase 1